MRAPHQEVPSADLQRWIPVDEAEARDLRPNNLRLKLLWAAGVVLMVAGLAISTATAARYVMTRFF